MMAKSKAPAAGRLSIAEIKAKINKKHGQAVAYSLTEKNPTDVEEWIPTGSRWNDPQGGTGLSGASTIDKLEKIKWLRVK